jgi:hypothetical protein
MTSLLSDEPKRRRAFGAAVGRMVLWSIGILLFIHLFTWLGPEKDGSPMLPGWAELVVWAQFILPVVPAVIAGTARIRGHEKWKPVLLGAVMGVLTPLFNLAILIATFLAIGGSIDLGPHNENISEAVILSSLFATTILLGVGTGSLRHKPPRTI